VTSLMTSRDVEGPSLRGAARFVPQKTARCVWDVSWAGLRLGSQKEGVRNMKGGFECSSGIFFAHVSGYLFRIEIMRVANMTVARARSRAHE
jgi:hypothetical protein